MTGITKKIAKLSIVSKLGDRSKSLPSLALWVGARRYHPNLTANLFKEFKPFGYGSLLTPQRLWERSQKLKKTQIFPI